MSDDVTHGERVARVAATLLHDVGKYVARTARNLPSSGATDPRLVAMMVKDLYATFRGERASVRFAELADELESLGVRDARLIEARSALQQIDSLEAPIRAADEIAVASAAEHALAIEKALRALARDLAGKAPYR